MTLTFSEGDFDRRAAEPDKSAIAKIKILTEHAATVGSQQTIITTDKLYLNGYMRQIKYQAPALTTDTEFTFKILDRDGATVYSTTLADNITINPSYSRIAEDSVPLFCCGDTDYYQLSVTWATSQAVLADTFKFQIFLSNY